MLEDDLQLSDSDNSDGEESQTNSVVSAHSSSIESESSKSDSWSDSESEGNSSDSEVLEPPRVPTPEPDPDIWQLRHYMNKVGLSTASAENHNLLDHEQSNHWESKRQGSIFTSPHESPKNLELSHKKSPWTSPEQVHNKEGCRDSPVVSKTVTPRQTAGIKQPSKSFKSLGTEDANVGLKVESEPYRPRDQPSKEKPSVKTKDKIELKVCKDPSIAQTSEKKKHKSFHHVSSSKKSLSTHSLPQCPPLNRCKIRAKPIIGRISFTQQLLYVRTYTKTKCYYPLGTTDFHHLVTTTNRIPLLLKLNCLYFQGVAGKTHHLKNKKESSKESSFSRKEESESQNHSNNHSKRKVEEGERNGTHKKMKLETEVKSNSNHKQLPTKKAPKEPSEIFYKKHWQEKPMSLTEHTHKIPEKLPQKRHPKNYTNPFPVPSLPNVSPEHYMKEAKKLKHKADAMEDFKQEAYKLYQRFKIRGYKTRSLHKAYQRALAQNREDLLYNWKKSGTQKGGSNNQGQTRLILTFNENDKDIRSIIHKHWDILSKDPTLSHLVTPHPLFTYKTHTSIGDILTQSHFQKGLKTACCKTPGSFRYGCCEQCRYIKLSNTFGTGECSFDMRHYSCCTSGSLYSDKIGKSFNIAMEADVQAPKSAYTMIAETVDLIKHSVEEMKERGGAGDDFEFYGKTGPERFILKLKNFTDSSAPAYEKSFAVLW
ncbi:hypothetical protein XELAEV_18002005mg [Xenopus laevis]|nr:hypothetical protein XELAEV_18002005mg [Xenopus laevis]